MPIFGSQIIWNGLEITAEKSTGRRHQIDTVLVRRAAVEDDEESEDNDDD